MKVLQGLTHQQVAELQKVHGKNVSHLAEKNSRLRLLKGIVLEPMFLLLSGACLLYFLVGEVSEGAMMLAAMIFVGAVAVFQEARSSRALEALKDLTEPRVTVVRNNEQDLIHSSDLVPGDVMVLTEGMRVPADAEILQSNDLSVNESILTGESLPVNKGGEDKSLYHGTLINSGKCFAFVTAISDNTRLSSIGKSIAGQTASPTSLQKEITTIVRRLFLFGLAAFVLIFCLNYYENHQVITSLLFALTLAMAAIPEEIPVAFSSFMALGAYYLSKKGIIIRTPQVIESIGAVTTLCLDKTGTITQNSMEVKVLYDFASGSLIEKIGADNKEDAALEFAALACEKQPFDEMERAILAAYVPSGRQMNLPFIHEYPIEGVPPIMTHVYQAGAVRLAASKGAAERIMKICRLPVETADRIEGIVRHMASRGYRVLGVAGAVFSGDVFPESQDDFDWEFKGLVGLYDPPRKEMFASIKRLYSAGIDVKLLTGDYVETAKNIALEVGIITGEKLLTGNEVMLLADEELRKEVKNVTVFGRMFPDAKLRVVEALKTLGEVVAMTGDGVNDGSAIKAADIGIAMGKRGTEVARQAADIVITDDNPEKILEAITHGRKIFSNLKKAFRYIISIHIPIILTASVPLLLGWKYPNIFTPIHVIFLEIIMGPTCSVFFENEPAEVNAMNVPPRDIQKGLFNRSEVLMSVLQGLIIALGILSLYYIFMPVSTLEKTRTVVFTTLICSNIFLTLADRSFIETFSRTIKYRNVLVVPVLVVSTVFLALTQVVVPVRELFGLTPLSITDFMICFSVAAITVGWFEVYKFFRVQKDR